MHADQARARALGKRYSELTPVVETHRLLRELEGDLATARELAVDDESFRAEVPVMEARQEELEAQLQLLLLPRDQNDDKDVILEIKAGEGGDESALFAGDLLRMYLRYAERRRLEDRGHRRHRVRPGRLQGHLRRGEVAGHPGTRATASGRG